MLGALDLRNEIRERTRALGGEFVVLVGVPHHLMSRTYGPITT
jgi:hypothetical protein